MKIADIRSFGDDELVSKSNDLAEELFKLKFKHGIRQLENTSKLKKLRKSIARIETVRSEKRLAAVNS
jgi:large subunit ribosomal protein L29